MPQNSITDCNCFLLVNSKTTSSPDDFSDIGYSGSWIYQVKPLKDDDNPELPLIVKIGSISLIEKELGAYQECVQYQWPGIAKLYDDKPVFPDNSNLAGLRYSLMGGGVFKFKSLFKYFLETDTDSIVSLLNSRLFQMMKDRMLLPSRVKFDSFLKSNFDRILPPDLFISPLSEDDARLPLITPDNLLSRSLQPGDLVRIKGFSITKVDLRNQVVNLILPPDYLPNTFTIRLQLSEELETHRFGQRIGFLSGKVLETRRSRLDNEVKNLIGGSFDPESETVNLSDGSALCNPLLSVESILDETRHIRVNYIHGDLNLENILVDSQVEDICLIDFAEARQDYVLLDFFRMEIEIITKLVSVILAENNLSPEVIYPFYKQLHYTTFQFNQQPLSKLPHPSLQKPFAIISAIRKAARDGFYDRDDFHEYYQGLTLYLLSSLKYKR